MKYLKYSSDFLKKSNMLFSSLLFFLPKFSLLNARINPYVLKKSWLRQWASRSHPSRAHPAIQSRVKGDPLKP
jgi:hypothetical protein